LAIVMGISYWRSSRKSSW